MDIGLGKHRVVLEFALTKRRSISGDDNEFGFARSQTL
jgi:hypothetical protein